MFALFLLLVSPFLGRHVQHTQLIDSAVSWGNHTGARGNHTGAMHLNNDVIDRTIRVRAMELRFIVLTLIILTTAISAAKLRFSTE